MRRRTSTKKTAAQRVAIYCRRSVSDDSAFTSIDAQREACEAYVASQKHAGWQLVRTTYEDMGFSGGNLDRPAMAQLLADVESGLIDIIVVHKVDRLSRSLIDFSRIADLLQSVGASFVSVTQQIDTSTPHGKLLMNQLLLFAEFERDMIADRTRTKMAAARKRGKHVGGMPVLGYDLVEKQLVVNEEEAERVRAIYGLYLEHRTVRKVVAEVGRRGWRTKRHVTAKRIWGGKKWTVGTLHRLLANVTYTGKIKYGDAIHPGEHDPIIDPALWKQVQDQLAGNYNSGSKVRNAHKAMLRDLLFCGQCGEPMVPHYTSKAKRRVRYYVCWSNRKGGAGSCPTSSLPAVEMERYVIDLVKERADSPDVVAATTHRAEEEAAERVKGLKAERTQLQRERDRIESVVHRLLETDDAGRLAKAKKEARTQDRRCAEVDAEIDALQNGVDADHVGAAIAEWRPLWENLTADERARLVAAMIERAEYDGQRLRVTWREMEDAAEAVS